MNTHEKKYTQEGKCEHTLIRFRRTSDNNGWAWRYLSDHHGYTDKSHERSGDIHLDPLLCLPACFHFDLHPINKTKLEHVDNTDLHFYLLVGEEKSSQI